jgi:hypothetical protein
MSDPYKMPRSIDPTTSAPGVPPRTPGDDYSRTNVRVDSAPSVPVRSGNGFATGLMVAMVFVVVAVLAYALVGNGDDAAVAPTATPNVAIQNNAAPAADPAASAPDAVAPDATAPEAVAPDAVAPEAVAPDAGTAEPVAPAPDAAPAAPANP